MKKWIKSPFGILSIAILIVVFAFIAMGAYWVSAVGILQSGAYVIASNAPTMDKVMGRTFHGVFGARVAVCDGTADNVEIQAAINASDGCVELSIGTFSVGAKLLTDNSTCLAGQGYATKLVAINALNDCMIKNSDTTNGNSNITIQDLYINGNKTNQGAGGISIHAIYFDNTDYCAVENCFIEDAWTLAIQFKNSRYGKAVGNIIDGSGDDGIGFHYDSAYCSATNNIILNAGDAGKSYGAPHGIEVENDCHDIRIENNTIVEPAYHGIGSALDAPYTYLYNIIVSGNTIYKLSDNSTGSCIGVEGRTGVLASNWVIEGNTCLGGLNGIAIYCGSDILIASNVIIGSGRQGISELSSEYTDILNNHISNCGQKGDYGKAGIGVKGAYTTVRGNHSRDTGGGTQEYGVYVYDTSVDAVVEDNRLSGNTVANYAKEAGATPLKARNNVGYVTENSGTATILDTTTVIAVTHGLAVTPTEAKIRLIPLEDPTNTPGAIGVSDNATATTFWIFCENDPGASNLDIGWSYAE